MLSRCKNTRRVFLKGLGGLAIGLPLCEELMGSKAFAQSVEHYNYVTCFFGLGCPTELQDMNHRAMAALKPYHDRGQLTHIMASLPSFTTQGGGNHEGMLPTITIAQPPYERDRIAGGPSLDYFLYQQTQAKPPIDIFSCGNTVLNVNDQVEFNRSYRGSNRSVTPTRNPMDFYREIFGAAPSATNNQKTPRDLLVDSVVENYRYLNSPAAGLSGQARSVISDTLDEVAQLQRRVDSTVTAPEFATFYRNLDKSRWGRGIANAELTNNPESAYRERRGQGVNDDRAWVVPLLADIFVLGLKLGQVRFGSYALTAGAERSVFGPYRRDCHEYYHSNRSGPVTAQVEWFVTTFINDSGYLLDRLAAEPVASGGTLLDKTTVLICTELERHHFSQDLFWAVAGGPFTHRRGRIGSPGNNGSDTDIYNTIATGILRQENPNYNPNNRQIFGSPVDYNGLITGMLG